jgi:aryl-alcohol dehydrogenase-like predicted oxidoreductase
MQYRRLGRTGLSVSVLGIGTGGPSGFGQKSGVPEEQAMACARRALDLGINYFDTSASYGASEEILGKALRGVPRQDYVLSTKFAPVLDGRIVSRDDAVASVERSLLRLGVDAVDILMFHSVNPDQYRPVVEALLPAVHRLREQGKCRFLGISETYSDDHGHEMVPQALADDIFDAMMIGYNLLSPGAEAVLPACQEQDVGAICMVAVRRSLSRPDHLLERLADAGRRGVIDREALPPEDPLGWLVRGSTESLPAAGYKFAAAHPAIATVLSGTANIDHLQANVRAILGPPLPDEDMARLRQVFAQVREPLGD